MKKITILVPAYNEEESLPFLYERVSKIMNEVKDYEFELLFVNDGSKDNTLNEIKKLKDNKLDRIVENVIPKECKNCKFVSLCKGGVVDRRYLWNGNLNKRDPYCFVDNPELMHKLKDITLSNEKFESVHDGYLPTMFFKSKKKVK